VTFESESQNILTGPSIHPTDYAILDQRLLIVKILIHFLTYLNEKLNQRFCLIFNYFCYVLNSTKMLPVPLIRENREKVINGLKKRNFANAEDVIEQVLDT